jgi:hypothetical protein
MATFTTKLKLGGAAFGVSGQLDPYIQQLTVGQIRVQETHPKYAYEGEPVYEEVYMCFETGIHSGTLWKYGYTIFSTIEEAQKGVKRIKQEYAIQIAERDLRREQKAERVRIDELETLKRLTEKYKKST